MSEQVNECNSKSNQILFDIIIKEIDEENGIGEDDTETGDAEVEQQQVAGGPQGVEPIFEQ